MASLTVDAALEARGWRVKHCTTLSDWLIMVRNLNVFFDCKSSTELILEDEMDTAGQATGNICSPMLFIPSSKFLCPPPPPPTPLPLPQQIKTIPYQCYPFITTDYLNATHYDFPTLRLVTPLLPVFSPCKLAVQLFPVLPTCYPLQTPMFPTCCKLAAQLLPILPTCYPLPTVCSSPYHVLTSLQCAHLPTVCSSPYSVLTSLQCAHLPTGSVHSLQRAHLLTVLTSQKCANLPTECSPPYGALTSLQCAHLPTVRSPPYSVLISLWCAYLPKVRSPPYSALTSLHCTHHLSTVCSPPPYSVLTSLQRAHLPTDSVLTCLMNPDPTCSSFLRNMSFSACSLRDKAFHSSSVMSVAVLVLIARSVCVCVCVCVYVCVGARAC